MPRVLQVLGREIEKIELVIHSGSSPELVRALEREAMDIAFLRPDETATGLVFRPLLEEELFVFMPANHLLAERYAVPPEALRAQPFISVSRSSAPFLRRVGRRLPELLRDNPGSGARGGNFARGDFILAVHQGRHYFQPT